MGEPDFLDVLLAGRGEPGVGRWAWLLMADRYYAQDGKFNYAIVPLVALLGLGSLFKQSELLCRKPN